MPSFVFCDGRVDCLVLGRGVLQSSGGSGADVVVDVSLLCRPLEWELDDVTDGSGSTWRLYGTVG